MDKHLTLNLGSGAHWMGAGAINVDPGNLVPPAGVSFLRAEIDDLSNYFEDGCASDIWAPDVLARYPEATDTVLTEWTRLLAPGGILHIRLAILRDSPFKHQTLMRLLAEHGLRLDERVAPGGSRGFLHATKNGHSAGNGNGHER